MEKNKAREKDGELKEGVLRFESNEGMIHEDIWGRAFQQRNHRYRGIGICLIVLGPARRPLWLQ